MIRVFLLERVIALVKRVIAIGDLLKPASWEKIAIAHGLVGLSFLLAYGFLDRRVQETGIPPVPIAQLVPAQAPIAQRSGLWSPNREIVSLVGVEPAWITLTNRTDFEVSTEAIDLSKSVSFGIATRSHTRVIHVSSHFQRTSDVSTPLFTSYLAGHGMTLSSTNDFAPGEWKLPSINAPERLVLMQSGSAGGQSLLDVILKLLALFQGITMMINGSVASILGLIAYHRNKVDMAVKHLDLELKRLQILQIQEALDKQARERLKEAEEAGRSSIVLIS